MFFAAFFCVYDENWKQKLKQYTENLTATL